MHGGKGDSRLRKTERVPRKKGVTRKREREKLLVREVEGKREREEVREERERERERKRQTDIEELERVMIVTTVVRTNEHLGTAFGIFQVSSYAQMPQLHYTAETLALIYLRSCEHLPLFRERN